MAQTVAVVRATLSATASGTTDFTSSGFGTPTAAIVILSSANTTSNPADGAVLSVGFWDGTNQRCNSIGDTDAATTAQNYRLSRTDAVAGVVTLGASSTLITCLYSCSSITDGIRLTLNVDNTGVQRYATVILFAGVSAKVVTHTPGGTDTSTAESASLGFAPKLAVFATIGLGSRTANSGSAQTVESLLSFGVTRQSDSAARMLTWNSGDALADCAMRQLFSESAVVGQVTTVVGWSAAVTTWGSDTFTTTTTGTTSGDICDVLALGGADISFDLGTLTTRTTTGTTDVTTTVDPSALLLVCGTTDNAGTIVTDSKANGWSIGLADATNEYSHSAYDEDAAGTMNAGSVASATAVLNLDSSASGSRTDLVDATVAFATAKFTLDYSAVSATARKGWWLAFGAAVSSLPTLSSSTYKPTTLTADGWQPRVTAS